MVDSDTQYYNFTFDNFKNEGNNIQFRITMFLCDEDIIYIDKINNKRIITFIFFS
jgi:hypothetical protein